ncbi:MULTISPECIES: YceI family protein [Caldimonas]|jgi:polyisoprenoid-binding protein YceI|uniref:YceI family protein n=1 Tax=Caldimonas TaxID=196013 RepID=UPI0003716452|nr:YceI family protein [Caldimonas manganoxidans]MCX7660468.1 YceI family protein [Caldimonas manganoxidans]
MLKLLTAPLLAASLLMAGPAFAQQKLLPAQSEIVFTSRQLGVPVEGRFKRFNAQLSFDPKKPEAGRIDFTVDLTSASLGAAEVEAELVKPEWFHTARFPQARFVSRSIKALGGGRFEVSGQLSLKGTARDLVVPVALSQTGGTTTASGQFTLQRLAFKIGDGEWADTSMVANEVQVRFKLALTGVPAL